MRLRLQSVFFRESGFTNAFQITSILSGIKIACVLVYAVTTDHFGRRNIVIALGAGCVLFLLVIGIIGQFEKTDAVKNSLIAMACLWSACNVGCECIAALLEPVLTSSGGPGVDIRRRSPLSAPSRPSGRDFLRNGGRLRPHFQHVCPRHACVFVSSYALPLTR